MKKIFLGLPVMVLAALVFVPKASAAGGARLPSGMTSIPITRQIENAGSKVTSSFIYKFTEKEGNPAKVTGLQATTKLNMNEATVPVNSNVISASCSLMLTSMVFPKVGEYAFELKEVEVSDEANIPRDTNVYEVYVHVYNVLDDNNNPTGELRAELVDYLYSAKDDAKVGVREAIFRSSGNFTHISLDNKVTGAAADTEKYFAYQITFEGLSEGFPLTVSGQDESVTYNGESVATVNSFSVGSDPLIVYLKHGQTVVIGERTTNRGAVLNELPQGISYTITKLDDADGYAVSLDGESVMTVTKTVTTLDSENFAAQNTTVAGNNKEAAVNTGVVMNILPFVGLAAVSVGGLFIFRRLSAK